MIAFTVTVIVRYPSALRVRYHAIAKSSADVVMSAVDKFGACAAIIVRPI